MEFSRLSFSAALSLVCFVSCSHGPKQAPPPEPVKMGGPTETFTGKVVLVAEGYRLKLSESEELMRLTRAKKSTELVAEEINLRKYYEKRLAVRGRRQDDWIWSADVIGQWLQPGERRGSNLAAPPVGH